MHLKWFFWKEWQNYMCLTNSLMHAILQALYEWTKEKHDDKLNARWTPPQKMWRWTWTVHKMAIDFVHVTTIVIEDLPVLSEKLINYGYIQISKKNKCKIYYYGRLRCTRHCTVPCTRFKSSQLSIWLVYCKDDLIFYLLWFFALYGTQERSEHFEKKLTDYCYADWGWVT